MSRLTDKQIGYAMLCVQIPLFIFFSGTYVFPIVAVVLGLAGLSGRLRLRITNDQFVYVCLALVGLMYLKYNMVPIRAAQMTRFLGLYGLVLAQYFLLIQAIVLLWERPKGLSKLFPLPGGLVLMFLGDKMVDKIEYVAYQITVLVFVGLFALFARAKQERRIAESGDMKGAIALVAFMAVVFSISVVSSRVIFQYQNELDRAFMRLVVPPDVPGGTRLNREVELGSVSEAKQSGKSAVALRIISDEAPGYMRGAVFDRYRSSNWYNSTPDTFLKPIAQDTETHRHRRFRLSPESSFEAVEDTLSSREIWPSRSIGDMVFTQLHTTFADIDVEEALINEHDVITAEEIVVGAGYTLYVDETKSSMEYPAELESLLLTIPDRLNEDVRVLADTIFEGATTPLEKINRVVSYLQKNYVYNMGVEIPRGEDPLTYFLLERPSAHCELFASGAAILLRLGGVPCRYVTGYVALEQNPVGEYWVARSKDAHAWVEAWDEEEGWVIVEATPASGVPSGESANRLSYSWDELKFKLQQFKDALLSGELIRGLRKWVGDIARAIWEWTKSGGWLILAGILVFIAAVRRIRRREIKRVGDFGEDAVFRALLAQMDAYIEPKGYRRGSSETLTQFSHRLSHEGGDAVPHSVAEWYETYSASRYDPARTMEADIRSLKEALEILESGKTDEMLV